MTTAAPKPIEILRAGTFTDASGNLYITHASFTRLIGGNLEGTTGTTATGTVSRWDNTGAVQWMTAIGGGATLVLTSDDVLLIGGPSRVAQVFTDGTLGWKHDAPSPVDCETLSDGAAVFVTARRLVSGDTSFS